MTQYPPAGFRNLLRMTHNKHLLVEGPNDKIAFKLLLGELYGSYEIAIVSASIIDAPLGNRDKVEEICRSVNNQPFANKLVGFTDREFRKFEWHNDFLDHLGKHQVSERLVWSRGHSVENYCFDFAVIEDAFRGYTDYFEEALSLLNTLFETVIRLGCAATLAGIEAGNRLTLIQNSVDWELVEIKNSTVILSDSDWQKKLQNKFNLQTTQAEQLVRLFNHWYAKVKTVDFSFVRWFCHGHIGFTFVVEVYARCIYEVCDGLEQKERRTQVKRFRSAGYDSKFTECMKAWSRGVRDHRCEYPQPVFELLGLSSSHEEAASRSQTHL